jgi:signal transduction histidine kinase
MGLTQPEIAPPGATTTSNLHAGIRLRGYWLLAARVSWIALALTIVALNILALPGFTSSLLTPGIVQELRSLNFSQTLYIGLNIGITATCILLYLAISMLLFWLRSADRMAFLCSLMLLIAGGVLLGFILGAPPSHLVWNVVVSLLSFLGQVFFVLFFYLFPSGRFVPRWTLWLALLWIAYQLILTIFFFAPFSGPPVLLPLFLLTALIAQVYRYRAVSSSRERQQTKWVVFGMVLAILLILVTRLIPLFLPPSLQHSEVGASLFGGGSFYLAMLLLPVFIGIAILRSQLFDINLIINRTLVYGLLTAFVVGFYILVVGYLGAIFRAEGNLLISLIATGLVAVLFQPLRNVLQRAVNRLVYGLRDEPYVALSRLSQRLRTTLEPDAVLSAIVATVRETLKLSYAAIEVPEGASFALAAASGAPPTKEAIRLPLVHQGEAVGTLLIAPRGRDDTLTPADLRLLDDLTHQIGTAVHTVRLTSDLQVLTRDLQHSREKLVAAREEERRRLRRDLHDGLGPMLSAVLLKVGLVRTLYRRDPETTAMLLQQLENEIESVIGDIRHVVYNLRPPALDELGLIGALREYVARLGNNEAMPLNVAVEAPEMLPPLPAAVEVAAYRIAQEAVTNVLRHACAQSCIVRIWVEDGLRIEVSDDGIGMDETEQIGVGLTSMRERAEELGGTFATRKNEPRGMLVAACLPLPAPGQAEARV